MLVAAFLGMGIGMIRVKREKNLTQLFLPLLLLLTGACVYFSNILVVAPRSGEAIYAIYYDLSPHSREWGMVPVVSVIFSAGRKNIKNSDWTLFLLGASFLLLETKSVTEMSLLFGSTWQVNVLVFAAILMLIFGANLFILRKGPFDITRIFFGLFIYIGISYAVLTHSLLALPLAGQWIAGVLVTAVPLFFAGMLFSQIFENRQEPTTSLGYNLMGTICGDCWNTAPWSWELKTCIYWLWLFISWLFWFTDGRKTKNKSSYRLPGIFPQHYPD